MRVSEHDRCDSALKWYGGVPRSAYRTVHGILGSLHRYFIDKFRYLSLADSMCSLACLTGALAR